MFCTRMLAKRADSLNPASRRAAIVDALLAEGAAVDVQGNDGATALIFASYFGYTEIVEALLANGANTELKFQNKRTALDLAKNATIKAMLRAAAKP